MKNYIITTYAENNIGILNRILNIFSKRMVNVESLTVVETEEKELSKIIIVITSTEDIVSNIVKQIDKQIGIIKTAFDSNTEVLYQKISLYRIITKSLNFNEETIPVFNTNSVQKQ